LIKFLSPVFSVSISTLIIPDFNVRFVVGKGFCRLALVDSITW
jgi:hypothetical protein